MRSSNALASHCTTRMSPSRKRTRGRFWLDNGGALPISSEVLDGLNTERLLQSVRGLRPDALQCSHGCASYCRQRRLQAQSPNMTNMTGVDSAWSGGRHSKAATGIQSCAMQSAGPLDARVARSAVHDGARPLLLPPFATRGSARALYDRSAGGARRCWHTVSYSCKRKRSVLRQQT